MKYSDGQDVQVGDIVGMGKDESGIVVCDIGSGINTLEHPETQWKYLRRGVMIDFPIYGLIHYEDEVEQDVHLVSRGKS